MAHLILLALLFVPSVALADPITVTVFFAQLGLPTLGVFIANLTIGQIVGAALLVNGVVSAKRQRDAAKRAWEASLQDRKVVIRSAESPRTITYGRDRVGGTLVYACTSGTNSEYLHLVIAIAGHEIDAIEEVYVGEDALGTLDASGWVTSVSRYFDPETVVVSESYAVSSGAVSVINPPTNVLSVTIPDPGDPTQTLQVQYTYSGTTITVGSDYNGQTITVTYSYDSGIAYVRVKKFLGIAAGERDTDLETDSAGQWTSAHLGKGVARLHVTLRYNTMLFPSGVPNISAVIRGKKIYDTRTSTTAWTDNAALCARDYIVDSLGFGDATSSINTTLCNTAANVCEESVTTTTGTQDRYTCNGTISTADDRIENLSVILSAMVGTAARSGGEWLIRAGAYVTPALDLDDDDLADGQIDVGPALPKRELFNAIRGRFVNPNQSYAVTDFPPYASAVYATADGGTELFKDITLPMTNDIEAAQRIAKLILHRARQALVWSATFKLTAYKLQPGDTFRMTSSLMGWSNKVFRVVDRRLTQPGQVKLVMQEEASAVYDWTYTEATNYDPAPNTNLPAPWDVDPVAGLAVESSIRLGSDGVWRIDLSAYWDASTDAGVLFGGKVEIVARNATTGAMVMTSASGDATSVVIAQGVVDGHVWNVWARNFNNVAYSTWTFAGAYTIIGKTDAPNPATNFTATNESFGVRLAWTASTSYDVTEYQIRIGSAWDTGTPIGSVKGTSFFWKPQTAGSVTFRIRAVDAWGNLSTSATAAISASVPGVSGLSLAVDGDAALMTWTAPSTSYQIADYEVRVGSTYGASTLLGYSLTTSYRSVVTSTGSQRYWITARDVAGSLGTSTSVDMLVSVPTTPAPSAEVVDNFVLLRWADCKTTLPVTRYVVYRNAAEVGDNGDGRFATIFETAAGTYSYGVKAIDSAGNESTTGTTDAVVSAPPDYILRDTFDSSFSGTLTNALLHGGKLLAPLYVETDAEHTTRLGALLGGTPTDQDAITAGYDKWWEPGHTTSSYVETFDMGSTVDPSTITVTPNYTTVQGAPAIAYEIKTSTTGAFAGEEQTYTGSSQAYASSSFRYIRLTLTITGSGADDLLEMAELQVKVATKLKTESGVVNVTANPTTVYPSGEISTILAITLTPSGSAARIATYSYTSGTDFSVYLFDAAGSAATGTVAWTIRGV